MSSAGTPHSFFQPVSFKMDSMPTSLPRLSSATSTPQPDMQWVYYEPSPIMARAHEFENGERLTLEVAKRALLAAYDAETTPHDRWEIRAVIIPRDDGTSTFRINYERAESDVGKPIASLGISDETALEYLACDYIHHRMVGYSSIPLVRDASGSPPRSDYEMFVAVNKRMEALHADLLCFIIK